MRLPFGNDPATLSHETWHEDGDGWVIEKRQDVTDIIEANRQERNAQSDYRPFAGRDMVKFASVPLIVIEDMIRKHGIAWYRDMEAQKRWIMDKEQEAFQTCRARLL